MKDEFFVGWSNTPGPRTSVFLALVSAVFIAGLALVSVLLSRTIDDPGQSLLATGALPNVQPDVTLTGTLTSSPYPIIMLAPDAMHPQGHAVLLTGDGKHGFAFDRAALEGARVEVKGVLLKRGALDMLVVSESPMKLADPAASARAVSLGQWRLVGEICDGKCAAGAMSPGTGLAHKACASLCLLGNVPAVFVSAVPLEGQQFMVIADERGNAHDHRIRDFIAMRVALEGEVERRGDLLVLRTDLARARRL